MRLFDRAQETDDDWDVDVDRTNMWVLAPKEIRSSGSMSVSAGGSERKDAYSI